MIFRVKKSVCLLTFLLLFFSLETLAQQRFHFFYGKIMDKTTRKPLGNVNLSVQGTRTGTFTDPKGEYSFYLDSIPAILTVSHVGYLTKKIILDTASYKMTLYLSPEIKTLQEVVISAQPQEAVFKDPHYSVLDYEIDSGRVYLLIFRSLYNKPELLCMTPGGDTLAQSGPLPYNVKTLDQDCLGYLHAFGNDSVYQLSRVNSAIRLVYPVAIHKYFQVLAGCVASTAQCLFFKRNSNYGLSTEFYSVNKRTFIRKSIGMVTDEKKAEMLVRNPEDMWFILQFSQPGQGEGTVSESSDEVRAADQVMVDWLWIKKIVYPPVKSFLYRIGDFICIFNTPDRQMEFYDLDGNYSYKVELKLDLSGEGRWTYEILADPVTLKVYTPYLKNGIVTLYEIDLNTGGLTRILSVVDPFPQKLRVYEDYLYYIYDNRDLQNNTMLFRQHL